MFPMREAGLRLNRENGGRCTFEALHEDNAVPLANGASDLCAAAAA